MCENVQNIKKYFTDVLNKFYAAKCKNKPLAAFKQISHFNTPTTFGRQLKENLVWLQQQDKVTL